MTRIQPRTLPRRPNQDNRARAGLIRKIDTPWIRVTRRWPPDTGRSKGGYLTPQGVASQIRRILLEYASYAEMGVSTTIQGSSAWTVKSSRLIKNPARLLDQRPTGILSGNTVAALWRPGSGSCLATTMCRESRRRCSCHGIVAEIYMGSTRASQVLREQWGRVAQCSYKTVSSPNSAESLLRLWIAAAIVCRQSPTAMVESLLHGAPARPCEGRWTAI